VPEITGQVHHLNLSVSDLERSAGWYGELFDLHELVRLSDEGGAWSKVILRHGSGLLVGLTQHDRNDGAPFAEWQSGMDHVALSVPRVDDLQDWLARLDDAGVERSEIKATPLGMLVTIRDPDNIQIELYAPHQPARS
jgi:glyoxylase I family protein